MPPGIIFGYILHSFGVLASVWGTGIRGLMRGMATLPKITSSY